MKSFWKIMMTMIQQIDDVENRTRRSQFVILMLIESFALKSQAVSGRWFWRLPGWILDLNSKQVLSKGKFI